MFWYKFVVAEVHAWGGFGRFGGRSIGFGVQRHCGELVGLVRLGWSVLK